MNNEQIKKRLEKLSTSELEDNLISNLYNNNERNIVLSILNKRGNDELVIFSKKDRRKATFSLWAAWIAAIASIISVIITVLTLLKS